MSTTRTATFALYEVPWAEPDRCLDACAAYARAQGRPWDPVGGAHEGTAALHSADPGLVGARWSWFLTCPVAQLRGRADDARLDAWEQGAWRERARFPDPFAGVAAMLAPHRDLARPDALPFAGGAVGLFAYACRAACEPAAGADPPTPLREDDARWALYDTFLALDLGAHRAWVGSWGLPAWGDPPSPSLAHARAAALAQALRELPDPPRAEPLPPLRLQPSLSPQAHSEAVAQVLAWIGAGDLYQACLTYPMRAARPPGLHARALFEALRRESPAPYAALLVPGGPLALAGASPERFLEVRGGVASARPMKGTRPRMADPLQDLVQRQELRASLKDRAENVMIVDLMRNDLGRVCALGSVEVPALFEVESYRATHQMTSTVRGRLAPGVGALDAARACFPPGSMTGAPKVEAMRRLQALEAGPRGWYSGALGYVGFDGDAELSVVIRSALVSAREVAWHVGGGIVADSEPEAEWLEALSKCPAALRG